MLSLQYYLFVHYVRQPVYRVCADRGASFVLQGRVDVKQDTGELKLLVKINAKSQGAEAKKSKAVKDLKQLSGNAIGSAH
jgi:hypothetical protein